MKPALGNQSTPAKKPSPLSDAPLGTSCFSSLNHLVPIQPTRIASNSAMETPNPSMHRKPPRSASLAWQIVWLPIVVMTHCLRTPNEVFRDSTDSNDHSTRRKVPEGNRKEKGNNTPISHFRVSSARTLACPNGQKIGSKRLWRHFPRAKPVCLSPAGEPSPPPIARGGDSVPPFWRKRLGRRSTWLAGQAAKPKCPVTLIHPCWFFLTFCQREESELMSLYARKPPSLGDFSPAQYSNFRQQAGEGSHHRRQGNHLTRWR
jgi:hypothetical protein